MPVTNLNRTWHQLRFFQTLNFTAICMCYALFHKLSELQKKSELIGAQIFTARKRSCGKVMFLHLSVLSVHLGGGGFPACITDHMTSIRGICLQDGVCIQGKSASNGGVVGVCIQGEVCLLWGSTCRGSTWGGSASGGSASRGQNTPSPN